MGLHVIYRDRTSYSRMGLSQAIVQAMTVASLQQQRRMMLDPAGAAAVFDAAVTTVAAEMGLLEADVTEAFWAMTPNAVYEDQEIVLRLSQVLTRMHGSAPA